MNHWLNKRIQRNVKSYLEAYVQTKMGSKWEDLDEQELYVLIRPYIPAKLVFKVAISEEQKSFIVVVAFGLIFWKCKVVLT